MLATISLRMHCFQVIYTCCFTYVLDNEKLVYILQACFVGISCPASETLHLHVVLYLFYLLVSHTLILFATFLTGLVTPDFKNDHGASNIYNELKNEIKSIKEEVENTPSSKRDES